MTKRKRVKITAAITTAVILVCVSVYFIFFRAEEDIKSTKIFIESAENSKKLARDKDTVINVRAKGLNGEYPAADMVITFDKNKLEFIEVLPGDTELNDTENNTSFIPEWSYDERYANTNGELKLMYLDISGGSKAYRKEYEKGGVLFRLHMRVKSGISTGEKTEIGIKKAKFASVNAADTISAEKGIVVRGQSFTIV